MGRRPATRIPKVGLQELFEQVSRDRYNSMAQRFGPKRNENNVVISPGRELPFTLYEFRQWLLGPEVFKGSWDNVVQCSYCNTFLNVKTIRLDHKIPAAAPWLGSLGLENLCPACADCNNRKGKCSAEGFRALIDFLTTGQSMGRPMGLDPRDVSDILTRLATGGEGAKMMWKRHSKARHGT